MLPSVFIDRKMIIRADGADSECGQCDRKIRKDECPSSFFDVIQACLVFFRTEGHAGEKEKGRHVERVDPPENGMMHGHDMAQHHQKQGKALGNVDIASSRCTHL